MSLPESTAEQPKTVNPYLARWIWRGVGALGLTGVAIGASSCINQLNNPSELSQACSELGRQVRSMELAMESRGSIKIMQQGFSSFVEIRDPFDAQMPHWRVTKKSMDDTCAHAEEEARRSPHRNSSLFLLGGILTAWFSRQMIQYQNDRIRGLAS